MLVSPATVTRVNGAGCDEQDAAKTSIKIEPITKEILLPFAKLDAKALIVVLPSGKFVKCNCLKA